MCLTTCSHHGPAPPTRHEAWAHLVYELAHLGGMTPAAWSSSPPSPYVSRHTIQCLMVCAMRRDRGVASPTSHVTGHSLLQQGVSGCGQGVRLDFGYVFHRRRHRLAHEYSETEPSSHQSSDPSRSCGVWRVVADAHASTSRNLVASSPFRATPISASVQPHERRPPDRLAGAASRPADP